MVYFRLVVFIFISLLSCSVLNAQGGESGVPFLLIPPDPRITGMGETGTGIADNSSAIFLNPGGLAFQKGWNINLNYSKWLPMYTYSRTAEPYYLNLSGTGNYSSIGTFSFDFFLLNLGEQDNGYYLMSGAIQESKRHPYEYYFLLGYAREFGENLGLGINLKYIRSDLRAPNSPVDLVNSWCFDLGILYKLDKFILPLVGLDLSNRFSFGLNLMNMGPEISYVEDGYNSDPIPTNLRLGLGFKIIDSKSHELTFATDFSRLLIRWYKETDKRPDKYYEAIFTAWSNGGLKKVVSSFGLEYRFKNPDFTFLGNPIKIALRTGYLYENPDYGNIEYYTFGGSVGYSFVSLDFSFIYDIIGDTPISDTYKWGLSVNL